jgi:hypothetical protein
MILRMSLWVHIQKNNLLRHLRDSSVGAEKRESNKTWIKLKAHIASAFGIWGIRWIQKVNASWRFARTSKSFKCGKTSGWEASQAHKAAPIPMTWCMLRGANLQVNSMPIPYTSWTPHASTSTILSPQLDAAKHGNALSFQVESTWCMLLASCSSDRKIGIANHLN